MTLYKLRDWLDPKKLNIYWLCQNPSPGAIEYIIHNRLYEKFRNDDWQSLYLNPDHEAIDLLEKNEDKIRQKLGSCT